MGVNTFLLDRRTATLLIGDSGHTVGTLRRFFKLTELDAARAAELDAATRIRPSPPAALIMDITELPLAGEPGKPVAAHLVLGWDEGRGSVTDFGWDYLPPLGYAVRDPAAGNYILHEERSGLLHPIDMPRARVLGLLDTDGALIRLGQPRIASCETVRPCFSGYAEADCIFDDGRKQKLLIAVNDSLLPAPAWLVGKKPMQAGRYAPEPPVPGKTTPAAKPGGNSGSGGPA